MAENVLDSNQAPAGKVQGTRDLFPWSPPVGQVQPHLTAEKQPQDFEVTQGGRTGVCASITELPLQERCSFSLGSRSTRSTVAEVTGSIPLSSVQSWASG